MSLMKSMLITGGSGFIGRYLSKYFSSQYKITLVSRTPQKINQDFSAISWEELDKFPTPDIVINLAGENLFGGLFTAARKEAILQSRLEATRKVAAYLKSSTKPVTLFSASGVHYRKIGG